MPGKVWQGKARLSKVRFPLLDICLQAAYNASESVPLCHKAIASRLRTNLNKTSPHKTMLIKIGKSAVSAKEVSRVFHCFSSRLQKGIVRVYLFDGSTIEESFNSEPEAEAHKKKNIH